MKSTPWLRFSWDLSQFTESLTQLPVRFTIREARKDERELTLQLIKRSMSMDSSWTNGMQQAQEIIETSAVKVFEMKPVVPCLLLCDGPRPVGASILQAAQSSPWHLESGPCILSEYCNRGLGSLLLEASLKHLKGLGLEHARAITYKTTTLARFLYPKFDSVSEPYDLPGEEE